MNESIPQPRPLYEPTVPAYKDRSTGLTIFGILTILLGCLAGLIISVDVRRPGGGGPDRPSASGANFATLLPAVCIYGVLAVALVWLGIGSTMARRWARALLLIFSWSWLGVGFLVVVMIAFFIPTMMANMSSSGTPDHSPMPASMIVGMMVGMFLVFGVFFIILPAVWTFFYGSRHVKATCETRDPLTRWTDAFPLPVLGFCLWLLFSVPMMLIMPLVGHGVMPFFGMFLTGLPGTLLCLAIAALWSYAAWLLYKLDVRGWWLILIALCVLMVSSLLTFARHDMLEMYHLMGYPEAQVEQLQKTGFLAGNRMTWLMSFSMLPFLGYLLFVKKYFQNKA